MKELWQKNKVLIVLGVILLICFIIVLFVSISYFMKGNKDKRENTYEIKSSYITELKDIYLKDEKDIVEKVNVNVKIKTLSLVIYFKEDTKLEDAEKLVEGSLEKIDEKIFKNYDVSFILRSSGENKFTIMGSKNMTSQGLVWNNNTPLPEENNEEDSK